MQISLEGRVALVTGGSRGIGRSICQSLANSGAFVWVNYSSSPDAAAETVAQCPAGKAEAIHFNVSDSSSIDQALNTIKAKSGKLDILVNNAGLSRDGLAMRFKDEDWNTTIQTNLSGAFFTARAAMRLLLKSESGRIINISSVVGEMGNVGQVAYVSSKAGLNGLTKALALELSSRAITVNAVAPGFIVTDMTNALGDDLVKAYAEKIPLGRLGNPEEISNIVTFLASDKAGYITGQVLGVNGGMYLS